MRIKDEKVANIYANDDEIWVKEDKWHFYTFRRIKYFIIKNRDIIYDSNNIINAGSGGNNYGFSDNKMYHIDLVDNKIKSKPRYIVGSLNKHIPLRSGYADTIICVGSVINYCDAVLVINELARLQDKNGHLILEFECSKTLELLFSKYMNARTKFHKTYYRDEESYLWYYSESYIKEILNMNGYIIVKKEKFHFMSPLFLKITKNLNFSNIFSKLDYCIERIPILNRYSSNIILIARKVS
ncbi:MAG TPA: hypothetical protein VNW06_05525 [Cytophagaceae bacterium]|jgi:hypothetical protein|nr:hypothetical protein [Cytophagaceae bacterium]